MKREQEKKSGENSGEENLNTTGNNQRQKQKGEEKLEVLNFCVCLFHCGSFSFRIVSSVNHVPYLAPV